MAQFSPHTTEKPSVARTSPGTPPLPRATPVPTVEAMTIRSMDNVGIVVEDLAAAVEFFEQLGLTVQGATQVSGEWVDRVVGLDGVRSNIAVLQTPDGHGRIELMQYVTPAVRGGDSDAPPNTLGIRRIAFTVDDLEETVAGLRARGTQLMGDVENFKNIYKLCYLRGPEGIMLMLAEELGPD